MGHMAREQAVDTLAFNDVRQVVKTDHARILARFAQYLVADPDARPPMMEEILHDVLRHLETEEDLLYPEIRRVGTMGRMLTNEALLEHEEVRVLIQRLRWAESDDDHSLDELFEDMMHAVRLHFDVEEHELLLLAGERLDTAMLTHIGASMIDRLWHHDRPVQQHQGR